MSRLHSSKSKAITERRFRLAKSLARRLREYGYVVHHTAWTDIHGARLLLWEMRIGMVRVMVRPVGHVLTTNERYEYDREPYPYLQIGSGKFDTLLRYLESVNR